MGLFDRFRHTEDTEDDTEQEPFPGAVAVEEWLRERVPRYDDGVEDISWRGRTTVRLTEPVDLDLYDIGMHLHGYETAWETDRDGDPLVAVYAPTEMVGGGTPYVRSWSCRAGCDRFRMKDEPFTEDGAPANHFVAKKLNTLTAYLRTAYPAEDEDVRVQNVPYAGEERIQVAATVDGAERTAYVRPQRLLDPEEETTTGERVMDALEQMRG